MYLLRFFLNIYKTLVKRFSPWQGASIKKVVYEEASYF
jgi:hypothetical protein